MCFILPCKQHISLTIKEHPGKFEIITPSLSILAQPSVTVVDEYAKRHKTVEVAKAYLEYLYSDEAQRLAGRNYYRPSNSEILKEFSDTFNLEVELVNINDHFGGWTKATEKFFADGAIFDQIYKK